MDGNHKAITDALRAAGWHVQDCSRLGQGFPDLIAARRGRVELIEVKDDSQPLNKRKLSENEAKVHLAFAMAGVEVRIVESVEEAVRL